MARMKKVKQQPEEQKRIEEEKLDNVFRIFRITNSLKATTIVRIELPNNEVHQKYYGLMPKFEVVIPYIGQEFELYLDGELVGVKILKEASKEHMKWVDIDETVH